MADHIHNIATHSVTVGPSPGSNYPGAILLPGGTDKWIEITLPETATPYDDNNGDNVVSRNPVKSAPATIMCGEYSVCHALLAQWFAAQESAAALKVRWTRPTFRYFNPDNGTVTMAEGAYIMKQPTTGGGKNTEDGTWEILLTKVRVAHATALTVVP